MESIATDVLVASALICRFSNGYSWPGIPSLGEWPAMLWSAATPLASYQARYVAERKVKERVTRKGQSRMDEQAAALARCPALAVPSREGGS